MSTAVRGKTDCFTTWGELGRWRRLRDVARRGHSDHTCKGSHAPYEACRCWCGASTGDARARR